LKRQVHIACLVLLVSTAQAQQSSITLEQALAQARNARPTVAAAQLRLTGAKQSRRSLGAYPATRLFVGHTDKEAVGGLDDDLVLVQPVDLFGRVGSSRAVGDAEVAKAEADLRLVLGDLQAEVISQYSEVAAARALAASASDLESLAQRLHDAVKTLVDEGKLPGVQLSRVALEVQRAGLTRQQRDSDLHAGLQRLAGTLNLQSEGLSVSDFSDLDVRIVEPHTLQQARADLQMLAADVRSAQAEARLASLGNKPELELHGRQSSWHDTVRQYGIRVQLSFPLFDFGKTRNETAAARSREAAAKKALEDATKIAESELLAARIELEAAKSQVRQSEQIVNDARTLVEKSRTGFIEKAITLVELLEATRALRETEERLIEARLKLANAQAGYLKASGQLLEVEK